MYGLVQRSHTLTHLVHGPRTARGCRVTTPAQRSARQLCRICRHCQPGLLRRSTAESSSRNRVRDWRGWPRKAASAAARGARFEASSGRPLDQWDAAAKGSISRMMSKTGRWERIIDARCTHSRSCDWCVKICHRRGFCEAARTLELYLRSHPLITVEQSYRTGDSLGNRVGLAEEALRTIPM